MAGLCAPLSSNGSFLFEMLEYFDCQAQTIGEIGYRALASPASSLSPLLTLALTIFVALIGYRFLIGDPPRTREAVLTVIKIGIVLMLATSWPSFRTLVYDVTMRGPAQLAEAIGSPAGLPGVSGGLNSRLQGVDDSMAELLVRGTGQPNATGETTDGYQSSSQWIPFDPIRNGTMLANARSVFLASTIGAFASVRLVAGVLLALGPIFAMFILFGGTRGLIEGWLRGLVGAALGATAISLILAVEIALMEPWLANVLAARRRDIPAPSIPIELFVATLVFALVLIAALFATVKVAGGFRFPDASGPVKWVEDRIIRSDGPISAARSVEKTSHQPSRAQKVADAVQVSQRREGYGPRLAYAANEPHTAASYDPRDGGVRTGRQRNKIHSRRSAMRPSSQAQVRDRK